MKKNPRNYEVRGKMYAYILDSISSDEVDVESMSDKERIEFALMTDVEALRCNGVTVSCINMSCGYYEPHTDHEFTVVEDVKKCHAFVCHLIEHCTSVYPHKEDDYEYYGSRDEWNDYSSYYSYDECLDYCCNWLKDDPQLTLNEFIDAACMYFPFSKSGFAEIFETASNHVKSEIV